MNLPPISEPIYPMMTAAGVEDMEAVAPAEDAEPAFGAWREVHLDSHRDPEPAVGEPEPEPEPVIAAAPQAEPEPDTWHPPPVSATEAPGEPMAAATGSNAIFEEEPALRFDQEIAPATPPRKPDTAMRLAVGLGAAACVLLAAVLYEGGWLAKGLHNLSSTSPTAAASVHASASASPRFTATPSASPLPPPAPVLFTLGNGVSGNSVFRIRPGTAVAGYTRLVFDMHGGGLPTMIITRPDDLHIAVTFKRATRSPASSPRSSKAPTERSRSTWRGRCASRRSPSRRPAVTPGDWSWTCTRRNPQPGPPPA